MLKCNICHSTKGVRHNTHPIILQEEQIGSHVHLCNFCFEERYKNILNELEEIENKLLQDITDMRKFKG